MQQICLFAIVLVLCRHHWKISMPLWKPGDWVVSGLESFVQAISLLMRYQKSKKLFLCNFSKVCVFIIITYFFRQLLNHRHNFVISIIQNYCDYIMCKKFCPYFIGVLLCCALFWGLGIILTVLHHPDEAFEAAYLYGTLSILLPNILWESKYQMHHH